MNIQTNNQLLLKFLILSFAMLGIGMLFYGFYNKLIIIQIPKHKTSSQGLQHRAAHHKQIGIWYWDGARFEKEDREVIYSGNLQDTLAEIVSRWLSVLEEEHLLTKNVTVQSVLLDMHNTTAYISFNRSPLKKEHSTYEQLMIIEGLLKTLRESDIQLKKVQLLVNHKPIQDPHLDFDRPWVIQGYSQS